MSRKDFQGASYAFARWMEQAAADIEAGKQRAAKRTYHGIVSKKVRIPRPDLEWWRLLRKRA